MKNLYRKIKAAWLILISDQWAAVTNNGDKLHQMGKFSYMGHVSNGILLFGMHVVESRVSMRENSLCGEMESVVNEAKEILGGGK